MAHSARTLDRLSARGGGTERVVGFVIVVVAVRSAVIDVERLVWEWFLNKEKRKQYQQHIFFEGRQSTYMASMTIETITMILTLELSIRRRHGLLLNR
jgi:hypothetical protein